MDAYQKKVVTALRAEGLSVLHHPPAFGATVRIYQTPEFGEAFGFGGKDLSEALGKVLKRRKYLLSPELQEIVVSYVNQNGGTWYRCPGCGEWDNYDDPDYDMFFPEDSEVPFHNKCYDGSD